MSNQTLAKTKFVQTDNERYSSEELFYSQLTREEKMFSILLSSGKA